MAACDVKVVSGRNMWLLARTDRDGASEEDVLQSAVAFLQTVIGEQAKPYELIQIPDGRTDVATAVIGNARPVVVTAKRGPKGGLPPGPPLQGVLQSRQQDCDEIYTVKATRPWWVKVGFDWRASDRTIPWPRLRVNAIGLRDRETQFDNDWLLVEYRYAGETGEDISWGDAMIKEAGETLKEGVENVAKAATSLNAVVYSVAAVVGGIVLYKVFK